MKNYIITEELMVELITLLGGRDRWNSIYEYEEDLLSMMIELTKIKDREDKQNDEGYLSDAERYALDYYLSIKPFEITSDPNLYKIGREIMKNKLT